MITINTTTDKNTKNALDQINDDLLSMRIAYQKLDKNLINNIKGEEDNSNPFIQFTSPYKDPIDKVVDEWIRKSRFLKSIMSHNSH